MSYRDLKIEHSYISRGDNNIADSFLNPVLKCTKEYKRSVGFFSSGVLETITDGALSLARNGGSIKLIASPKLSEEDVEAINLGYEQKNQKQFVIAVDRFCVGNVFRSAEERYGLYRTVYL